MSSHVPTSQILEALMREAPPEHVTLGWLLDALRDRSFGIIMLLLALVGVVPGASIFVGGLLIFPAAQMMLARSAPVFPKFLTSRRIPTVKIAALTRRVIPMFKWAERFIGSGWRVPVTVSKRPVGLISALLALSLIGPIPFSHILPIASIMLISFAYLEENGLLLIVAGVSGLASLGITVATVWGTVIGIDLI